LLVHELNDRVVDHCNVVRFASRLTEGAYGKEFCAEFAERNGFVKGPIAAGIQGDPRTERPLTVETDKQAIKLLTTTGDRRSKPVLLANPMKIELDYKKRRCCSAEIAVRQISELSCERDS
jgi:hypothetical protein